MKVRRYLLDTNTVSQLVRENLGVLKRIAQQPTSSVTVSSISVGELMFGLAKRGSGTRWSIATEAFLRRVEIMSWNEATARRYGVLRAELERTGKSLSALDTQIAAHALALDMILVTGDIAFRNVPDLQVEDWSIAAKS